VLVEEVAGDVAQGARDPSPEQGVGHGRRWLTSSSSNQRRALRHGWSRRARVGSWQVELGQGGKRGVPAPMEEEGAMGASAHAQENRGGSGEAVPRPEKCPAREDPGGGREQEGAMAAGSACALEEGEGVLCARLKEKRGRNGCGG
jgi:hypothetical protein